MMLKYYFILAMRNISKRRLYALINITGLAIGLTSFILIALYIIDELSYDRHHKNAENIYRVINKYDSQGVGEESSSCPFPVGDYLAFEYPDMVQSVVRFYNNWSSPCFIEYGEKRFKEHRFFYADSTIFEIFDIPLVNGNPETVLKEPGSVIMTESTARRYFGDEDPIGKTMNVDGFFTVSVTGIMKDPGTQSHFTFDILASMSTMRELWGGRMPQTWVWNPFWTYVLLKEGVNPEDLNRKLPGFVQKYFYDAEKEHISLYLQPLLDIHLRSALDYEIEHNGNIVYIRILGVIAGFMLIIAFINFMNLSTAMAGSRAREIGIKKVFGSYQRQLIFQFITESVVISIISLVIALALVEILLPYFNDFTGKSVTSDYFLDPNKLLLLLLITVLTGFVSGIYPAFYLSSFQPVPVIRGDFSRSKSGINARKVLVVVQFAISIILIIGTVIMHRQLDYMKKVDLGFNRENILFLPVVFNPIASSYDSFKAELLKSPDIKSVTTVDYIVGTDHNTHEFRPEGFPPDQWQFYPALIVGNDFLETFDIKVLAGRGFTKDSKTDPTEAVMINEAMVKYLGWNSNEEALGKKFRSLLGKERVTGVFRDFNATSLHSGISPMVLSMEKQAYGKNPYIKYIAIRHNNGQLKESVGYIEKVWDQFVPGRPFEYLLHKNELDKLYREEIIMHKLAGIFTVLVIFIAGLGLFGLASYTVDQRTKEIGIRRVMGASLVHITGLLTKELNWLIVIATLIAWPVAYFMLRGWLDQYSARIRIDMIVFLFAGVAAFLIAFLISFYKAVSSFSTKPVDTLKYE
jgi:putative ABC transport system permease protein